MQSFVELRFRGLRLAEKARFEEVAGGGFVEHEAPLPVGTSITLVFSDESPDHRDHPEKTARVTGVVEQEANAASPPGMRLAWQAIPMPVEEPPGKPEPPAAKPTTTATPTAKPTAAATATATSTDTATATDTATETATATDSAIDSDPDPDPDQPEDATQESSPGARKRRGKKKPGR